MICYTCGKFIKRGHGENTYYYAGKWRYYCFFCLRWNYCSQKIVERRQSYFWMVSIPTLILAGIIYWLVIWLTNVFPKFYFSWLALILASLPIIGVIILWQLKIKPKLNELDKKDWKPLLEEQTRLTRMENYVYSLKRDREFCHCEKCLVAEWKKRKEI